MIDTTTTKIYCNKCNCRLFSINGYTECYKGDVVDHYLCTSCANDIRVEEYQATGTISTSLWIDATLYHSRKDDGQGFDNLRDSVRYFYERSQEHLSKVFHDMEDVNKLMKEFETRHWIPWLCDFYKDESGGFTYKGDGFKASLLGSCGRVLLTVRDIYPQENPNSKYGGAWLSLIFADGDKSGNGGIQGLCATKEEAIGLLKALIAMPEKSLVPDKDLAII